MSFSPFAESASAICPSFPPLLYSLLHPNVQQIKFFSKGGIPMPWLTLVYIMILCGGMGVLMAFSHPAIYVGDRRIAAWDFSRQFPEIHISTKYMSSYVQDQEDVEVYGTICSYLTEFNIRREDAFDYFDHNLAYLCVGFLGYGIRNYLIGTPPSQLWDILYDVGDDRRFHCRSGHPAKNGEK